jgi:purine-binding chemotaxis protein CheW
MLVVRVLSKGGRVISGVSLKLAGEDAGASLQKTDGERTRAASWLRCRVGDHHFALPMTEIIETMRMLPIEVIAGAPAIVRGLCIVRGEPVPIVDTALLFGEHSIQYERIVTARVAGRTVGFAADAVVDVRSIAADAIESLPPLFGCVDSVSTMTVLDEDLVFFLSAARVIPDDFLAGMNREVGA